ncbi:MAG: ABC transporter substrate-binding protein [Nocardioidaceae bacterium]
MRCGRGRACLVGGALAGVLLAASGCQSGDHQGRTEGDSGHPRRGGTLRLVGDSDVGHLDTASVYSGVTYTIERAFTRQLVTYPSTGTHQMPTKIVPDLARKVPTVSNGGISDRGRTYTYVLKKGVKWDTKPPRQVTAADVERGIKGLCNPVSPSGALGYYESTVVGMASYCDAFLKVPGKVPAIRKFIKNHDIEGLTTSGKYKVVFHLRRPANDFNNIMTLPFSSPAPAEYLNYLPDGKKFRQHTISSGPYQITTYKPNKKIVLKRDPAWAPSTDDVRRAYVNKIVVEEGYDAESVQRQLQAGTADMEWDTNVPPPQLPGLASAHDPRLLIYSAGSLDPYLVVNFQSPNARHATGKLGVRRALEYAVNKAAVVQTNGGPRLNDPLDQVITPHSVGYQKLSRYSTPGHKGDPRKARNLLAGAGYPKGLTLTLAYTDYNSAAKIAQVLQADLEKAGIQLRLHKVPLSELYSSFLVTPSVARRGAWDVALVDWGPDWFGNNGRTTVQPLLDGSSYGPGSTNYGDYDSQKENSLIRKALAAPDQHAAARLWHRADRRAMRDAALVPIEVHKHAIFHSRGVHHLRISPFSRVGDVTNVWLSQ